ncbi:MAG TPA: alpha/beta fold hydrolase [Candidatus Nanopelagicaceae bacterium]|nr:alpha/beta fold hydrolase [Candidatus Nanopelagicaceae bacterium]
MTTPIRANTVLPARRTPITLKTSDGLKLVGELALPLTKAPVATMVCLHPLPTHGGMMDSHVFRKASWRLPALADIAVLRFNTRGTESAAGKSDGKFSNGVDEANDVAAAIEFAKKELPNIWIVGWSFGTDLALKYGLVDGVKGAILLSPPLRFSEPADLELWRDDTRPLVALVPEFDDYLRPEEARQRFEVIPQAEIVPVDGAKHLWVGEPSVYRVLNEIVERLNPEATPLPLIWSGEFTEWRDLPVINAPGAHRDGTTQ